MIKNNFPINSMYNFSEIYIVSPNDLKENHMLFISQVNNLLGDACSMQPSSLDFCLYYIITMSYRLWDKWWTSHLSLQTIRLMYTQKLDSNKKGAIGRNCDLRND